MKEWIILKVFPKEKGKSADFKVCFFGDELLPSLLKLTGGNSTFHAYYPDDREHYPEGAHFKFFVKTKKRKPFLKWKKHNEKRQDIDRIEKSYGNDNEENKQLAIAGDIFKEIKNLRNKPLEIINILKSNQKFLRLNPNFKGKHFLRLMLIPILKNSDERILYSFLEGAPAQ